MCAQEEENRCRVKMVVDETAVVFMGFMRVRMNSTDKIKDQR